MTIDTGAQLRSLYQPEGGVTQIFSSKVTDYVASRPDYPAALFEALRVQCHLQPGATVVDVGAGTGLLTRGLLELGCQVWAIEPNAAMRRAADQDLASWPAYRSAPGTAESLPMADSSADLITAAQAFHWFDVDRARAEFLRVLRPQGQVALIWNDRVASDPLHLTLGEILDQHGGAKRGALVKHEERGDLPKFFGDHLTAELSWPHEHCLSEAGLLSLAFSRSYMPERDSATGRQACEQLRQLYRRFASDGKLIVRYNTVAIIGRPC
jgi:SAM-dependent methyltransferase